MNIIMEGEKRIIGNTIGLSTHGWLTGISRWKELREQKKPFTMSAEGTRTRALTKVDKLHPQVLYVMIRGMKERSKGADALLVANRCNTA